MGIIRPISTLKMIDHGLTCISLYLYENAQKNEHDAQDGTIAARSAFDREVCQPFKRYSRQDAISLASRSPQPGTEGWQQANASN